MHAEPDARRKTSFSAKRVLLLGGGRWGRVHADVLCKVLPKDGELLWVSHHNRNALETLISGWGHDGPRVRLFDHLAEALPRRPDAAVIATSPRTLAANARAVLDHGIHSIVEKPFALCNEDAAELLRLADKRGLILGVGLHLFYASYLPHFRSLWNGRNVVRGRIVWLDPEIEFRYGEIKKPDFSTPKLHDAFPHVWSILQVLFPGTRLTMEGAETGPLASTVLSLSLHNLSLSVVLDRRADERSRRIELEFADGGTADLDFTIEPGIPRLNGTVCSVDPDWSGTASPLSRELTIFLAKIDDRTNTVDCPTLARTVVESISAAVIATAQLRGKEALALASILRHSNNAKSDATVRALLVDNLLPEMADLDLSVPQTLETLFDAAIAFVTNSRPRQADTLGFFDGLVNSEFLLAVKARYGTMRGRKVHRQVGVSTRPRNPE